MIKNKKIADATFVKVETVVESLADFLESTKPIFLEYNIIESMNKEELTALLSGTHQEYPNKEINDVSKIFVKLKLNELNKNELHNTIFEVAKEAKKPHIIVWASFIISLIALGFTAAPYFKDQIGKHELPTEVVQPPVKASSLPAQASKTVEQ